MTQLLYTLALFLLVLGILRFLSSRSWQPKPATPKQSQPQSIPSTVKTWVEQTKAAAADRTIAKNRASIVADLERQFHNSPSHNPDT